MLNIYVLIEFFTNGLYYFLLDIISVGSVLSGIFVIIAKNPVVSVLFLIGLFISIAGYLMMLGITFIGLSYLLVYVGAVSILFLFILMLINVRVSELVTDNSNSIPLAIMIGVLFNMALNKLLPSNFDIDNSKNTYNMNKDFGDSSNHFYFFPSDWGSISEKIHNIDLYFVTSQMWDGMLAESSHITSIGNIIYTSYPLWLILTSIILLLAMVGAIVITIKK